MVMKWSDFRIQIMIISIINIELIKIYFILKGFLCILLKKYLQKAHHVINLKIKYGFLFRKMTLILRKIRKKTCINEIINNNSISFQRMQHLQIFT